MVPGTAPLLVIVGPTASGKTAVAVEVAKQIGGEVVSADSVAIYAGLVIGSAAPTPAQREMVRFHLVGCADPRAPITVAEFKAMADASLDEAAASGRRPVLVGGTGLYVRAVVDGLGFGGVPPDPELRARLERQADALGVGALHARLAACDAETAARLHPNDRVRIVRALEVIEKTGRPLSALQAEDRDQRAGRVALQFGLMLDRDELDRRIEQRVEEMISLGLVDEVQNLLAAGLTGDERPLRAIGYKEIVAHLRGEISLSEAVQQIKKNTRRYARRQLIWWRSDPRIHWIEASRSAPSIASEIVERACL